MLVRGRPFFNDFNEVSLIYGFGAYPEDSETRRL